MIRGISAFYLGISFLNRKKIFLKIVFSLTFFLRSVSAHAQYIFRPGNLPEQVSILEYASIADAGSKNFSLQQVKNNTAELKFKHLQGVCGNLGFTDHIYWIKFVLKNDSPVPIFYYLQTAEPVTDNVNLYLVNDLGKAAVQQSGDNINFAKRSLPFRKTLFKIELNPGEQQQALLEVKNDGEKNNLPLYLISQQKLLETTNQDQMVMGLFYGVLFVIAITYFFFYFALKELSFLYYSLYVTFVALCQFALDGFYHQYIGQSNSWINLHIVIISAVLGSFFFGKYSELILNIKNSNTVLHKMFKLLYLLLGLVLTSVILFPAFLKYAYPAVNVLTLVGMLLILSCIIMLFYQKQKIDIFYTSGIFILFVCILIAILMNFGVFPGHVEIDNITKPGIGLEIIALSLSMANRIWLLKSKQEELQAVVLQRSEEMNDLKSYFLSNMSHELRTPLNAILGLTNLMENETNDQKVKSNCEIIKYTSYSLISSVNDILDFSKIEKGELKLDHVKFNPYNILHKVSANIRRLAEEKGLTFELFTTLTEDITVIGDSNRLEQIIHNILNNAIKFTEKGSVKLIALAKFENNQVNLLLTISDTGIGIAKEKVDSVFGMFSQTDLGNKRKFGGFGVGLSVVKALVDLHNGTIRLESKVNAGTTCHISIDYQLAVEQDRPLNIHTLASTKWTGMHILVVEDNKMNQMVIKQILKRWDHTTVSFANNGQEGIEVLKKETFDVVLMDLQMPVMDGYEAIEAIRNGKAGNNNASIPIIVLTADATNSTKERVFELGVNDYLTKPIDQKLLYDKVKILFSLSKVV